MNLIHHLIRSQRHHTIKHQSRLHHNHSHHRHSNKHHYNESVDENKLKDVEFKSKKEEAVVYNQEYNARMNKESVARQVSDQLKDLDANDLKNFLDFIRFDDNKEDDRPEP